jgi:hypothetical protein
MDTSLCRSLVGVSVGDYLHRISDPTNALHFLRTFSSPSIFSILFLPIHNSSKLTRPDNSLSSMKRIRFAPRSIFFKFFNPLKPSIVLSLLFAKSVKQKFKAACCHVCKKWKRVVSIKLTLDLEIVNLKTFRAATIRF